MTRRGSISSSPLFAFAVKPGRNENCWCGSGLKFKKCHLGREKAPRLSRQEAIKASKSARSRRTCLDPRASAETCTNVIKAHSVQKSGAGLTSIAAKGHVYGYKVDFTRLDKTGGRIEPALIGVSEASTFTGFCAVHDSETFAPLERSPFVASREQIGLLGYRAICKELMAKQSSLALNPTLRDGDRGLPIAAQELWQQWMDSQQVGFALALKDLEDVRSRFESCLVSGDYSDVHGLIVKFDRPPCVLATSPITPEYDFDGRQLQDLLDVGRPMEVLTYSIVGTNDGAGAAVFAWVGQSDVAEQWCAALQRIPTDVLADRLVQFTFEYFENIFWSPDWWDSLSGQVQATLIDRLNAQVLTIRGPDCLRDDGSRSATWSVSEIIRL